MVATNRILIIVTNADVFEKVGFRTGLWLGELVEFWEVAEEAGYKMDIASPAGGKVPIDPESLLMTEIGDAVGLKGGLSKHYEDKAFMSLLDDTLKVSDADAGAYDAIYMTGGHGVMFDFPTSIALAELVARFYESGKTVSAVCHGPCGLLEARLSSGEYLLHGKNVTGYSWKEEILAKRDHAVSFSLEEELQKRGARYTKAALPFGSHVVEDGRLVTGQNPRSAKDVGKVTVKILRETSR
ncbi:type 1 glutamine amidotransferase domain-containing protein [Burkholderia multivorans]|uniref:type 1 glutamine amidotransferase domain-containing protein n=1 Tax=Burkholderia multivorans TaxID=87883 RepID=UPI000D004113|nr:type 1 glutamine amidotransferase domain-containing protein [Burkholderia multivorans]PRG24550.1 type 1 glutamine amidotransferase domain-containing protein [Burkholderia multivorans]